MVTLRGPGPGKYCNSALEDHLFKTALITLSPGEDELFSSWMTRVAYENQLRLPAFLIAVGHGEVVKFDLDVTTPIQTLIRLAHVTRQPSASVLQTSLQPLLTPLQGDTPVASPKSFLVYQGRGNGGPRSRGHPVCVACLAENGQLRRRWRLISTVICPVHLLPLIDRCPLCGHPINFIKAQKLRSTRHHLPGPDTRNWCPSCTKRMQVDSGAIPTDVMSAGLAVQGWVDQALSGEKVELQDFSLPGFEFVTLLTLLLSIVGQREGRQGIGINFPPKFNLKPFQGVPMMGLASPEIRLPILSRVGYLLEHGLLEMLNTLVKAGVGHREFVVGRMRSALSPWLNDFLTDALSKRPHGRQQLPAALRLPGGPVRFSEMDWLQLRQSLPSDGIAVPGTNRRKDNRIILESFLTCELADTARSKWSGDVGLLAIQRRLKALNSSGHLDQFIGQLIVILESQLCNNLPGTPNDWANLPRDSSRLMLALLAPETIRILHDLTSRYSHFLWLAGMKLNLMAAEEVVAGESILPLS